MPQDILAQTAPRRTVSGANNPLTPFKPKHHISILGVIITIILAIVLVVLGERILFDLNRVVNPAVKSTSASQDYYGSQDIYGSDYRSSLKSESSGLSNTVVYYKEQDKGKYMAYKTIIHAAVIIPIFLLMFLLYYLINIKGNQEEMKIVMWGYMVFAIWMMFHLIIDIVRYVSEEYKNAAIYIILGVLVLVLTPLAIFIQKKVSEKHASQ
ncbi:MAG: hypothetical protein V1892_01095 [bacterium]